jgi:RING finger/CHY zinc finger protein 1
MDLTMKKGIISLIWLVFVISCPTFALISKEISSTSKDNCNFTGVIIYRDYQANLKVTPNIIKTYGYLETNKLTTLIEKQEVSNSNEISYEDVNMLFALIPKTYDHRATNLSDKAILCMNAYLNKNYLSPTIKYRETKTLEVINKEVEFFLRAFNKYTTEQNLASIFSTEKKLQLSNAILGSYGLFMPTNFNMLCKFNGFGRVLASAVSIIDDLLITTDDCNNIQQNITKQQLAKLQYLTFKAVEQAKTVLFIPECIAQKHTNGIRLPIAVINKVSLDETTGQITLNLMFCNQAINDFSGFYKFINARNSLLGLNNLVTEWEFIDYTLDLTANTETDGACSSNNLLALDYKLTSIQVDLGGCINYQGNNQPEIVVTDIPTFSNEDNLLTECRQPTDSEIKRIENSRIINATTDNIESNQAENISNISETNNYYFCGIYKRNCLVKFDCSCADYSCCHQHHNSEENPKPCKINKFKARDIKKLKCLICNYEQNFNVDTSHSCINCKTKFSDYFCGICKHLTGAEFNTRHCEKCGICRIESDRLFHCDVCNMCLKLEYKNNHTCRENSADDECGICLEPVFKGCQVLPCSHKIHLSCFQELVASSNFRCPMCRENFASLLRNRPRQRR